MALQRCIVTLPRYPYVYKWYKGFLSSTLLGKCLQYMTFGKSLEQIGLRELLNLPLKFNYPVLCDKRRYTMQYNVGIVVYNDFRYA